MLCGRSIFPLIFIFWVSSTSAITSTKYMKSYCKRNSIFVNSSLILELTNDLLEVEPEDHMHCAVKLITAPGLRLLIHFITLDISFHNLTPDRLHIFDYDSKGNGTQVSPVGGLYGIYDQYYKHTSTGVDDYLSSNNMFRLDYMGKPSLLYRGFRILITTVKDPNPDGGCIQYYSRCSKGSICIPTNTLCNGDNNCGNKDDSDETQCNWVLSTGLEEKYAIGNIVTSGVLSCLSFIIVVGLVFGVVFRYNRRRYLRRESIPVHAKRNANGKWKITNDMGLTAQIFAPPTYDDVVADEEHGEPPPAYESLPCSVRTSCELGQSQNGSITIVCIESRDIHLYNEGSDAPNVQCYLVNNEGEYIEDVTSEGSINSTEHSTVSLERRQSEAGHSSECNSENDLNLQSFPLLSEQRKIDSNENLIRPKPVGILDDEIEYMDDEDP